MRFPTVLLALVIQMVFTISFDTRAHAKSQTAFIRDAEIENTIHEFATPLLRAADLDETAFKIHLINDPTLNAFVTNGMNMFIHTGLLMNADGPDQIIGVMAHEMGHITGGHIALRSQQIEKTRQNLWLSYVMGAAAALASGNAQAYSGVSLGVQTAMMENLMSFSRSEESQADQAGVEYMDKIGISSQGLLDFMKKLEGQELLVTDRQDPYLRSHPLTRDRIAFMENHVKTAGIKGKGVSPQWNTAYKRMRAKLYGFLENPGRTLKRYPEDDTDNAARYGRAIALYRFGSTKDALKLLDSLLKDAPKDPYYLELKGQILFESGDPDASIAPYRKSVKYAPDAAPIYLGLGRALIARGNDKDLAEAEKVMSAALRIEEGNPSYWKQLAIAQGRAGKIADAAYAMAEYTYRTGQYAKAKFHAGKAIKELPKGSPKRLRAQDISDEAKRQLERALKKKR